MPAYQTIPDLVQMLAAMKERIKALEMQQNWGIATGPTGQLVIRGGLQPDGTFGIWLLTKATGTPLVKLSDTGLVVRNHSSGTWQAVSADYEQTAPYRQTYSAHAWGKLTTPVTVSGVPVGPSHKVSATLSVAYLVPGSNAAGETARLGVAVDGASTPIGLPLSYSVGANDGLGSSVTYTQTLSGITPGIHTFSTLATVSTAGVNAIYTTVTLLITPL